MTAKIREGNAVSPAERFKVNQKRLPEHLQAPFEALKKQESKIKEMLSSPAGQEAFLQDPVAAMESAGIKVEPALRKALHGGRAQLKGLFGQRSTFLPNGATVTPRVRVRFTA